MHSENKRKKPVGVWILLILITLSGLFFIYFSDYYHADSDALSMIDDDDIKIIDTDFGWFINGPSEDHAFIFYPGAKVEPSSYIPFLSNLSEHGIDVFLVRMPLNFAIFGINSADEILSEYSYDYWYIGGHSLGGAMAADFASSHPESLDGIILFAAYSTKDIDPDLTELVIYGSEDKVLDIDDVVKGRTYAPPQYVEYIIDGGNHAQFGNYGTQKGDGNASISSEEQQGIAVQVIVDNIGL